MIEPVEISMPPEEITIVMPMAMNSGGVAWRTISQSVFSERKLRVISRLIISRTHSDRPAP